MSEKIKEINQVCLAPLKKVVKINTQDRYYTGRSNSGRFFNGIDIKLIQYIVNNYDKKTIICEPGCGYAQLLFGLGEFDFKCIGLEFAKWRYNGAVIMHEEIGKKYPKIKKNVTILNSAYPDSTPKADLLVINNFVATAVKNRTDEIIKSFFKYKEVILDAERFGIVRNTKEEKDKFIKKIESYGLKTEKLYDSFYLVRKK